MLEADPAVTSIEGLNALMVAADILLDIATDDRHHQFAGALETLL